MRNWEDIKREERSGEPEASVLDGVPQSLPALLKAYRMTEKAAAVGFDWRKPIDVMDEDLREEMRIRGRACGGRTIDAGSGCRSSANLAAPRGGPKPLQRDLQPALPGDEARAGPGRLPDGSRRAGRWDEVKAIDTG